MARNKINEDEYLEESFDLEQLRRLGFKVYVVDSVEQIRELMECIKK